MSITAILAFFTSGIGRWLALAGAVLIAFFIARAHFIQVGEDRCLARNIKAAEKIVEKQGKATERVITKYVKVAGETKVITNTIEKEVVKYATANLDQCPVSNAFVSLHDSAATGKIPSPAAAIDGSASGIKAADTLSTTTGNYATCHENAIRLTALQQWIQEQAKVK